VTDYGRWGGKFRVTDYGRWGGSVAKISHHKFIYLGGYQLFK